MPSARRAWRRARFARSAMVARALGFKSVTDNSIDAVSDRDFVVILFRRRPHAGASFAHERGNYSVTSASSDSRRSRTNFDRQLDDAAEEKSDLLELIRGKTGRPGRRPVAC